MKQFLFFLLVSVVSSQDIEVHKAILEIFMGKVQFLYLIPNSNASDIDMLDVLSDKTIAIRKYSRNTVLQVENEKALRNILFDRGYTFEVHKAFLVFLRSKEDIDTKYYHRFSLENNIEFIIVQGLENYSYFPPSQRANYLRIYSAMRNVDLLYCMEMSLACLANFTYKRTNWSPQFMLKKLKREFVVGMSVYPPFVTKEGDKLGGVDFELMKIITDGWPVHFKLLEKDKNRKRSFLHRYSVYEFNSSEADIGIASSDLTDNKIRSYPYSTQCNTFIIHRVGRYPEATFIFQFFQLSLWGVYICLIFFMAFFILLSARIYRKHYSFSYSLTIVIGYASSFGIPWFPPKRQTFLRFIFLFWCTISMLFSTYFIAGLTSSLRFPRYKPQVNTWQDMVQRNIRWLDSSEDGAISMKKSGAVYESLANLLVIAENDATILSKLREKIYALRAERFQTNYVNVIGVLDDYAKQEMRVLDDCYATWPVYFQLSYNSPFANHINSFLIYLQESGIVEYAFRQQSAKSEQHFINQMRTQNRKKPHIETINMQKFSSCMFFLGFGLSLGIISFLLEIRNCKYAELRERKNMSE